MSQHSPTATPRASSKTTTSVRGFRADIQGLRAIAVALVVLYHFWPHRLPGGFVGVDVFFVISGFLITSHLLNRPPGALADLITFWMRRVKRLLPASFVVILASLIGIRLFAPETLWKDWSLQALFSTFYAQNWFLAINKVDYMAEGDAASPFQHFWSLAVEEQFYFVWPVLIGALFLAASRLRVGPRGVTAAGIGLLFAASLAYSVYATENSAGLAYFSTLVRAWEFAAGAIVAVLGTRAQAEKRGILPAVASWAGLAAILGSAQLMDAQTAFPGAVALIPVLGTAVVLWAHATSEYSPTSILAHPLVQFTGDKSYAIYLWHWPLLILAPFVLDEFFATQKIAGLLIVVVLAALTQSLVETRFRAVLDRSPVLTAPRFLLTGSLALAVVAGGFYAASGGMGNDARDLQAGVERVKQEIGVDCFGPASMANDCQDSTTTYESLVPALASAKDDKPAVWQDGCMAEAANEFSERNACRYGEGKVKVALVGNSHAGHWQPALEQIARENDWQIDTYLAASCAISGIEQEFSNPKAQQGCAEYGLWASEQITQGDYDLVVSSNRQSRKVVGYNRTDSAAPAEKAYAKFLNAWADTGAEVVVLRDTPWPGNTFGNVPDCVAQNREDLSHCTGDEEEWVPVDPQYDAAKDLGRSNVSTVNLNDYLCQDGTCHSVVGGVLAFYDHSHLSRTFAQTMSEPMEERLREVTGDSPIWG